LYKAFLSHSSKDKKLVSAVFSEIGRMYCEMDEYTFESGLPNWRVIEQAFDRCSLFVLFASENSIAADWVQREAKEAFKRLEKGKIKRILVVLPEVENLKTFVPENLQGQAAIIGLKKAKPIARAIQRHLIDLSTQDQRGMMVGNSFIGREPELDALKKQLLDPSKRVTSVVVSGREFMGRSALIQRAIRDVDPNMYFVDSPVTFESRDSCTNLAIKLYGLANDYISPEQITEIQQRFEGDDVGVCADYIFNLIFDLAQQRQHLIIADHGGVIGSDGQFSYLSSELINRAKKTHSPLIMFITQRKVSYRSRTTNPNAAFVDISPLDAPYAQQYVVHRARALKLALSLSDIE
jgi:hypothetical protein